jgi:hypothetical protein
MSDNTNTINLAFGLWAALAGAALAAAIGVLLATVPVWGWIALVVFVVLWGTALLSFTDPASQAFLAGTLRKSTYTQIYTTLTKRLVMRLWARFCDPTDDRAGVPTLLRAALTWRLYDAALLIAVAYPIMLLVGQWIVTGQDGRIGGFVLLEAAPFWWDRAVVVGVLVLLILSFVARKLASASPHRVVRQVADGLPIGAVAVAAAIAIAFAGPFAGAVAFVGAFAFAGGFAGAIAFVGAFAFAGGVASAGAFAFAGAFLVAVAGAGAGAVAVEYLDKRGRPRAARAMVTLAVALGVIGALAFLDFTALSDDRRALFVFLAVLPLLNALFDTLSYAVTLTLMRRGLRSAWPFLWGLLDLAIACGLFLALGMTLVVVIHGLNLLAGVPLIDLPALFAGVHDDPRAYTWLYLMLFSTIVPTLLHAGLSLLGVQGIWPLAWRRPVADWIKDATASPLKVLRASLALGVMWTLPLVALGGILWALWQIGSGAITWALSRYFDALLWLAAVPVGAI